MCGVDGHNINYTHVVGLTVYNSLVEDFKSGSKISWRSHTCTEIQNT
jgi:hypothetical protein